RGCCGGVARLQSRQENLDRFDEQGFFVIGVLIDGARQCRQVLAREVGYRRHVACDRRGAIQRGAKRQLFSTIQNQHLHIQWIRALRCPEIVGTQQQRARKILQQQRRSIGVIQNRAPRRQTQVEKSFLPVRVIISRQLDFAQDRARHFRQQLGFVVEV